MVSSSSHQLLLLPSLGVAGAVGAIAAAVALRKRRASREQELLDDNQNDTGELILPLSFIQSMFLNAASLGVDHIVASVELSGKLPSKTQVETAIQCVKRHDPNLDYAITCTTTDTTAATESDDSKKYTYGFQKSMTAGKVICGKVEEIMVTGARKDDRGRISGGWKQVADRALNEIQFPKPTLDVPTPTWKVLLVVEKEGDHSFREESSSARGALIFVLHHAVFDGTSRNRLLRAILEHLNPATHNSPSVQGEVPIVSSEDIFKHMPYMSWFKFLRQCAYKFCFAWRTRNIPNWFMDLSQAPGVLGLSDKDTTTPTQPRETRQIFAYLPHDKLEAIAQRCKHEGTTVHGALSAAAMVALVPFGSQKDDNNYQEQDSSTNMAHRRTKMGCTHLVSVWNQLANYIPSGSLTGCYISTYRTSTVLEPPNINKDDKNTVAGDAWTIARDVKSELLQQFAPPSISQLRSAMKYNLFLQKLFGRYQPSPPPEYKQLQCIPTVAVSNNGRVNIQESYSVDNVPGENSGHGNDDTKGNNDGGGRLIVEGAYATSARHNASFRNLAVLNIQTLVPVATSSSLSCSSSKSSKLCVTLGYYSQIWTDDTANEYLIRFCSILDDMCC